MSCRSEWYSFQILVFEDVCACAHLPALPIISMYLKHRSADLDGWGWVYRNILVSLNGSFNFFFEKVPSWIAVKFSWTLYVLVFYLYDSFLWWGITSCLKSPGEVHIAQLNLVKNTWKGLTDAGISVIYFKFWYSAFKIGGVYYHLRFLISLGNILWCFPIC